MSNTQQKQFEPIGPPLTDLPQDMISLARQIVRDCSRPGRYIIFLDVPQHPKQMRTAVIAKHELITTMEMKR